MLASQQPGIGKVKVGKADKEKAKEKKTGVKITAAIFFDGTGNNRFNISKRAVDPAYKQPGWFTSNDDRESYAQYYSNVAIMQFMHKRKIPGERIASVYMEGIGTTDDGDDDTPGGGFGSGPTGIVDRVTEGIIRLNDQMKDLYDKGKESIEELTVYTFGFSRGAAASRHFVARRCNSRGRASNLCEMLQVDPAVVTVKFAGLFDSVSSFDESGDEPGDAGWKAKSARHARDGDKDFRNDQPELHMAIDDDQVQHVVQLAAADEYRLNFSLTDIGSARRRGIGFELLLPGAHSDIGGGYAQTMTEERVYNPLRDTVRAFPFFQENGWYGPGQAKDLSYTSRSGRVTNIVGTRQVSNAYQYVALSIMLKLAAQNGMQFGSPNSDQQWGIKYVIAGDSPLAAIKAQLESFALANYPTNPAKPLIAPLALPQLRWLRQHYLHLSWKDKIGFEMRQDKAGRPVRLTLPG